MTTDTTQAIRPGSTAPRRWRTAFAVFAAGVGVFELALALGAPWGAAAWGGANAGVLPLGYRVASGVTALLWGAVAAVSAGRLVGSAGRRRMLLAIAAYCTLGIGINAVSPSTTERAVWVPLTAVGAGIAWMAWREARR